MPSRCCLLLLLLLLLGLQTAPVPLPLLLLQLQGQCKVLIMACPTCNTTITSQGFSSFDKLFIN